MKVNHKEENKMQQTDSINGKNIDLDSFRKYWSCFRLLSTNMDSTTAKVAEEDFVVARQQDQRITADDSTSGWYSPDCMLRRMDIL